MVVKLESLYKSRKQKRVNSHIELFVW